MRADELLLKASCAGLEAALILATGKDASRAMKRAAKTSTESGQKVFPSFMLRKENPVTGERSTPRTGWNRWPLIYIAAGSGLALLITGIQSDDLKDFVRPASVLLVLTAALAIRLHRNAPHLKKWDWQWVLRPALVVKALMWLRRHPKATIALLISAHFLPILWLASRQYYGGWPAQIFSPAISLSQEALLWIWLALGSTRWYLRLTAVLLLNILSWNMLFFANVGWESPEYFVSEVFHAIKWLPLRVAPVVCLLLLSLRLHGWRIEKLAPGPAERGWIRLQFGVRRMFGFGLLVGVLFALGLVTPSLGKFGDGRIHINEDFGALFGLLMVGGTIALCTTCSVLLNLWTCLSPGRRAAHIPVLLVAALLFSILPVFYFRGGYSDLCSWATPSAISIAMIAGSLLVFRGLGYRFTHRSRSAFLTAK